MPTQPPLIPGNCCCPPLSKTCLKRVFLMCFVASQMQAQRRCQREQNQTRLSYAECQPVFATQLQSYKKSTHPARDEWRKIRVLNILTFGTFRRFCAIPLRYLLIHNRLPKTALAIVEGWCLCHTSIMLADVVIHSIAIVVDAFVGIALGKFLPEDVANGDDDGCPGFLLVERMIHRGQKLLYLL